MEPIKVNLASFEYFDKRPAYMAIISSVIIVLIISTYNFHLYNINQHEINNYEKKIAKSEEEWKKQQQLQKKSKIRIKKEEIKILKSNADFINRLIATDIFPWNQFLNMLERKVPKGLMLNKITPTDNYRKLILTGLSSSTRKITFFMKRLKEWNVIQESVLLNLNLKREGTTVEANGNLPEIEFRIESTLRIDKLFAETGYGRIGKILMHSSKKL